MATSPNGTATGFGAGIIIVDDLVKSAYEAHNSNVLDGHWDWFADTMFSRREGKRKMIFIMTRWHVRECVIESNNGGRGFARNVEAKLKASGNKKCIVTWFTQSKNKNTRIKVNAGSVTDKVIMPDNWEKIYPEFYKAVAAFQRKGKNEHDDAPDALTGLYELFVGEVKGVQRGKVLNRRKFGGLF